MTAPVFKKPDFAANARCAWGDAAPDWIVALAEEANRTNAASAARRIGYSPGVITGVLGAKYPGDMGKVEAAVRGALMGSVVNCPIVGEMRTDACLQEQKKTHIGTSETRAALYRACRGGCAFSRLKLVEAADV
jgi:hypothetical protein